MSGAEIYKVNEETVEILPPRGGDYARVAREVLAVGEEIEGAVDTVTSRGRVALRVRWDPADYTIDRLEERLFGAVEPSGGGDDETTHDEDAGAGDGDVDAADDAPADDAPADNSPDEEETTGTADDEDAPSLEEVLSADEEEEVSAPARSASKATWQDFLTDQQVYWSEEDTRDELISRWEERNSENMTN